MLKNTKTSYGSVAKFFHWLISPLVILMLLAGYFLEDVPEAYQPITYNVHKLIGLTILTLMLLRLCWALMNVKPLLPAGSASWERVLELTVHFSLYFFVILMPLAGWVGSVAGGRPPHIGDFMFNLPIEQNKELAGLAFEIHGWVAIILITLVSVHVLAALYHHLVRKDNILVRMLPNGDR